MKPLFEYIKSTIVEGKGPRGPFCIIIKHRECSGIQAYLKRDGKKTICSVYLDGMPTKRAADAMIKKLKKEWASDMGSNSEVMIPWVDVAAPDEIEYM